MLEERIAACDREIKAHARQSEDARRISALTGIGPLTSSALVATVCNAGDFRNGRQLAAWMGLVPKQNSSGGKERLGAITKRGDSYLRGLLVQGARSDTEVRPSTVKTWLTTRRIPPLQPTDHRRRLSPSIE